MHSELARRGDDAFLASRGLAEPDGRGLHKYELTDAELDELRWYVQTHEGFRWRSKDSAALVLLMSEWGYRNARSASVFVAKAIVELEILGQKDQIHQRLDEGLIFWKRRRRKPAMQAW